MIWQRIFFELGEYENALASFKESVDVIERFMYPDKQGYDAYPIGGTHANHAMTILDIAACMARLGRTDEIDALIEKAKHIYFAAYEHIELRDYNKTMRGMIDYFAKEYHEKKLDDYKPLDLSEIEWRVEEKSARAK